MNFSDATPRTQLRILRGAARSVLAQFPVEPVAMRLISQSYNSTYRVDTADGRRFALRINTNSRRRPGELLAEVSWVAALDQAGVVDVPVPMPLTTGAYVAWAEVPGIEAPLAAVLYSWLDGQDLGTHPPVKRLRALGAAMARMHRHAAEWKMPDGAELVSFDRPLLTDTRHLDVPHDLIDEATRRFLSDVEHHVAEAVRRVFAQGSARIIHCDMHGGNARWHLGKLSVFDFDDCVFGTPVQDLATALYYLSDRGRSEEAMRAGYESVAPLPDVAESDLEALLAARNLLILNSLLVHTSPAMRNLLPAYLHNTLAKLRYFCDHGRYRHDLPDLQPFL